MAVVSDTAGLTTVAAIDSTPFQSYGNAAFGQSNFGGKTNLHAITADVSVNSVIKFQRSIAELFGTVSDKAQKQSVGSVLTSRLFGVTRGTVTKFAFGSVIRTSAIFSTGVLSGLNTGVRLELLSRQIPFGGSSYGTDTFGGNAKLRAISATDGNLTETSIRPPVGAVFATELVSGKKNSLIETQLGQIKSIGVLSSDRIDTTTSAIEANMFAGTTTAGIQTFQSVNGRQLLQDYSESTFGKGQFGGEGNINSITVDSPIRSTIAENTVTSDIFSSASIETVKTNIRSLLFQSPVFAATFLSGLLSELRYNTDEQVGLIKSITREQSIQTTLQTTELPFIPFSDGAYGSGAFGGLTVEKAITANTGLITSIKDSPFVTDTFARSFIQPVNRRDGNKLLVTPEQQLGTVFSRTTEDGTQQLPEEYGEFGFGSGAFGGPETRNIQLTRILPTKRVSDDTVVVLLKGLPAKSAVLQQVIRSTENIGTLIEESNLTTLPIARNITIADIESRKRTEGFLTSLTTVALRTGDIRYIRKRVVRGEQLRTTVLTGELRSVIVRAGILRQKLIAEAQKKRSHTSAGEIDSKPIDENE